MMAPRLIARRVAGAALTLVATLLAASRTDAQVATAAPAVDSVLQRAEQMVDAGRAAGGRALVDSLLTALPSGTEDYAEALYVRASLAPTALDAERDYRRLTVEYSLSPRASDALLRLAQLELARGDRAEARTHLARLTHDRPPEATTPRANLSVARAYIELGDQPHACQAIAAARSASAPGDVELRNQLDYAGRPCPAVAVVPPPVQAASAAPVATTPSPAATSVVDSATPAQAPSTTTAVGAARSPTTTVVDTTATGVKPDSARAAAAAAFGSPPAGSAFTPGSQTASTSAPGSVVTTAPAAPAPAPAPATATSATTVDRPPPRVSATTVPTTAPRTTASAPPPASATTSPSSLPSAPRALASHGTPRAAFTVQVAAYNRQSQADDLAAKLKARGYDVRVWGVAAPFRVRVGRYPTRAEAVTEAAALAAKQITGWVVEAEPAS
jgi:cell division septation protein DedD